MSVCSARSAWRWPTTASASAIWTFPDWPTWVGYEQEWHRAGSMSSWRAALIGIGAGFRRTLMIDAPLAPLRTGRQPQIEDRRPLTEV